MPSWRLGNEESFILAGHTPIVFAYFFAFVLRKNHCGLLFRIDVAEHCAFDFLSFSRLK